MDEVGILLYLDPINDEARETVNHSTNRGRRRPHPADPERRILTVGTSQPAKVSSRLVTLSCLPGSADIFLPGEKSSNPDQCYFDLHPTTGELLVHDISKNGDTKLLLFGEISQIVGNPRQCVVQLEKECALHVGRAQFKLEPGPAKTDEVKEGMGGMLEESKSSEGTQGGPSVVAIKSYGLPSRADSNPLGSVDEIKCARRGSLGAGTQGCVDLVVDLHTGDYYARKQIPWKPVPHWHITTEAGFKERLIQEINLVKTATHPHVVPYFHCQGLETGGPVEIFMPVYEGNLTTLINRFRPDTPRYDVIPSMDREGWPNAFRFIVDNMFQQILSALEHIHSQGIVHRDIKPCNILFRGEHWALTDFGISKLVDASRTSGTMMGTAFYAAPEIYLRMNQTEKVDIYGLGLCLLECLVSFESVDETEANWFKRWSQLLELVRQHEPRLQRLLAYEPEVRPSARVLLDCFFRGETA